MSTYSETSYPHVLCAVLLMHYAIKDIKLASTMSFYFQKDLGLSLR